MNRDEQVELFERWIKSRDKTTNLLREAMETYKNDCAKIDGLLIGHNNKEGCKDTVLQGLKKVFRHVMGCQQPCDCPSLDQSPNLWPGDLHLPEIRPQSGPWINGAVILEAGPEVTVNAVIDCEGKDVVGLWTFNAPAHNCLSRANVALILAAPSLLQEAVLLFDLVSRALPLHDKTRLDWLDSKWAYLKSRLLVMIETATPILQPHSAEKGGE